MPLSVAQGMASRCVAAADGAASGFKETFTAAGRGAAEPEFQRSGLRAGDLLLLAQADESYRPQARRACHHQGLALERVTVDPAQMGGLPCIRGLRVTVSMLLGQLAAGRTPDDLLADYPYLEREDVTTALEYAAAIVNERDVPVVRPA